MSGIHSKINGHSKKQENWNHGEKKQSKPTQNWQMWELEDNIVKAIITIAFSVFKILDTGVTKTNHIDALDIKKDTLWYFKSTLESMNGKLYIAEEMIRGLENTAIDTIPSETQRK